MNTSPTTIFFILWKHDRLTLTTEVVFPKAALFFHALDLPSAVLCRTAFSFNLAVPPHSDIFCSPAEK
jgi:hypothetical protein